MLCLFGWKGFESWYIWIMMLEQTSYTCWGNDGPGLFWSWLSPVQTKHMSCLELQTYHQMEDEAGDRERHWHQQLSSCVSRCCCCCWATNTVPPPQPDTQDIRKIMREHIFSNLFTKTELLITPCWRAIASEGHIPRCVASKSWTEGHFQWFLIVCWWIRGEARPENYVNGFHLC